MGKFLKNVLKVGALFAIGLGVKKISENREAVKEEFEKAKNDPKGYAKSVQSMATQKAEEVSEQVKEEAEKMKNDPKGYASDLKEKATDKANEMQEETTDTVNELKENATDQYQTLKQQGKDTVEDVKDKMDDVQSDAKEKAEEVKSNTRNKMDDMKNQNSKGEAKYTTPDLDKDEESDDLKQQEIRLGSEGGLTEDEVKKAQEEAETNNVDVVNDPGEIDENYNIHVVTDDKDK